MFAPRQTADGLSVSNDIVLEYILDFLSAITTPRPQTAISRTQCTPIWHTGAYLHAGKTRRGGLRNQIKRYTCILVKSRYVTVLCRPSAHQVYCVFQIGAVLCAQFVYTVSTTKWHSRQYILKMRNLNGSWQKCVELILNIFVEEPQNLVRKYCLTAEIY